MITRVLLGTDRGTFVMIVGALVTWAIYITKVPAKGHTGSLPSTSLDHHISLLVASRGNLSFTDPI